MTVINIIFLHLGLFGFRKASKMSPSVCFFLAATSRQGNPWTARQRLGICGDAALGLVPWGWTLKLAVGPQRFAIFTSDLLPIKMSSSKQPTQNLQLFDSFTLHNLQSQFCDSCGCVHHCKDLTSLTRRSPSNMRLELAVGDRVWDDLNRRHPEFRKIIEQVEHDWSERLLGWF